MYNCSCADMKIVRQTAVKGVLMTDNMRMIIQAVLQGSSWSVDNAIETILKSDKAEKDKVFAGA